MGKTGIIVLLLALSTNALANDRFKASCSLRSLDKSTEQFDKGSVVQPVDVSVDNNTSVKLGEFEGYSFVAKSAGDGVQATAIDNITGSEITPVIVDGSRYSILRVENSKKIIVMDCIQAK